MPSPAATHFYLSLIFPERFDLYIDASRQIQFHQRVHGVLGRFQNVEEPFVSSDLKLLPRLLVNVRRTENRVSVSHRWQRDRPRHLRPGPFCSVDDFRRRLIEDPVVVRF